MFCAFSWKWILTWGYYLALSLFCWQNYQSEKIQLRGWAWTQNPLIWSLIPYPLGHGDLVGIEGKIPYILTLWATGKGWANKRQRKVQVKQKVKPRQRKSQHLVGWVELNFRSGIEMSGKRIYWNLFLSNLFPMAVTQAAGRGGSGKFL